MRAETWLKSGGEFTECHGEVSNGDGLHDPIGAADQKAGILAESFARIDVPSALLGKHGGEFGDAHSGEKCVDAAHNPNGDDQPWASQLRSDFPGRAKDAGAYSASDADRDAEAYADYAEQMAFYLGRISAGCRCGG